jgi:hypothetical protein
MEVRSFPRAFERKDNFLYSGNTFITNLRVMYKRPCTTFSSLYRGPVGEPGSFFFTGNFGNKGKCISGFLFLDPEDIKRFVLGPSGTLTRNRASLS